MDVTIRVSPFAPISEVVAFTQRVEDAGFDGIGFLDSQMINRDLFVTMTAAALATTRLRLTAAVTNPVTRHVSVLASTAASLDDIAPGRIEFWMGRGFSAVNLAGLREARTDELRDAARDFKRLLSGEWDVFPGTHSRMRNAGHRVPLYLAAAGPRTMRAAGEAADGVLLATGFNRAAWERAHELVAEGAKKAGRDPAEVVLCAQALTCIRKTREEALRAAGPLLVLRLDDQGWLEREGIDAKGLKTPAGLKALYPDPMHAEDAERALDIAETVPLELRAQIAQRSGLIGTPEDCIAKIQEAAEAGITRVFLRTMETLAYPEAEVDLYGAAMREAVATLTSYKEVHDGQGQRPLHRQ